MIDLHIHTTYSDGRESVSSVLSIAEESKAQIISITDHDSVGAYKDVFENRGLFSGEIICGAELSCVYKGYVMEVLAYGIDADKLQYEFDNTLHKERYFSDLLNATYQMMADKKMKIIKERFDDMLSKKGLKYAIFNEVLNDEYNISLMKNPDNLRTFSDFFRNEIYDPKGSFYIDHTNIRPSSKKVASIIKKCGGFSFIAHPVLSFGRDMKMIENCVLDSEFDGIECKYPLFSIDDTENLLCIASKNNKFVSGGSDFHGSQRANKLLTGLDGNLNVSINDVSPWIDKVKHI